MKTNHSLSEQLGQIGLRSLPTQLDDFLARATKARWSPHQLLEEVARAETAERSRRSLERRLRLSGIKSFKPMADFDWAWPTQIERHMIERALTLDFLGEARNLVLMGGNGLGKTMIAQNICHQAVLAGYSVAFRSAAASRKTARYAEFFRAAFRPASAPLSAAVSARRGARIFNVATTAASDGRAVLTGKSGVR